MITAHATVPGKKKKKKKNSFNILTKTIFTLIEILF
jgi:hypothetical protein